MKLLLKYKTDLIYITLTVLLFSVLSVVLWGRFGDPFYDCGRELYLPKLILQGKILYKDIFSLYNPLSYQINSLLYFIFGQSITTLQFAGEINALFIILGIYLISRNFNNPLSSFAITSAITIHFIFNAIICINYIFPYSYAMVYGLSAFLYSVLFIIYYWKTQKIKFTYISFLLIGIAFAFKPDFIITFLPLLLSLIIFKAKWYHYLINLIVFLLPSFVSYGILLLQGLSFNDLSQYFVFIQNLFKTEEQIYFNNNTLYSKITLDNIFSLFTSFIFMSLTFLSLIYTLKLSIFSKNNIFKTIAVIAFLAISFYSSDLLTKHWIFIFSWICIPIFVILARNLYKKENLIFSLLCFTALISCIRVNCLFLNLSYTIYFILFPFIVFWTYIFEKGKNYKLQAATAISLIVFSFFSMGFYCKYRLMPLSDTKLLTSKNDILYSSFGRASVINKTIIWINENTNPEDSIVILPEGIYINFVTNRKPNPKYYHLTPNHISAIGETKITDDFITDKPDYFILSTLPYDMYGKSHFCEDFGSKICSFIMENYTIQTEFQEKLWNWDDEIIKLTIYKKRMP